MNAVTALKGLLYLLISPIMMGTTVLLLFYRGYVLLWAYHNIVAPSFNLPEVNYWAVVTLLVMWVMVQGVLNNNRSVDGYRQRLEAEQADVDLQMLDKEKAYLVNRRSQIDEALRNHNAATLIHAQLILAFMYTFWLVVFWLFYQML